MLLMVLIEVVGLSKSVAYLSFLKHAKSNNKMIKILVKQTST